MSAAVIWQIFCDYPGCKENVTYTGASSMSAARGWARLDGWGQRSGGQHGDFCPNHKGMRRWPE